MSEKLPPIAVAIIHEVEDYDSWRPHFDSHRQARADAGVLGHHLNRGAANPKLLCTYMPCADKARAIALLSDDDTRAKMQQAGVKGTPDIKFIKPVSDDTVMDEALAAMIVTHRVADYAKWRAAYDAFDAKRQELGIVGHAVNQADDDPNTVVVYHQARSQDALQRFMASPELKQAMQSAGVASEPEVSFWNSQPGVSY